MAKKWLLVLLTTIICLAAISFVWASASNTVAIRRWVMAGGGQRITSGSTILQDTLGQPFAYQTGTGSSDLCAGFWCGTSVDHTVFLPTILNQPSAGLVDPTAINLNTQATLTLVR
jgi:hypothetical protein